MISYPNAGHLFIIADRGPSQRSTRFTKARSKCDSGNSRRRRRSRSAVWPVIYAFLDAAFRRQKQ